MKDFYNVSLKNSPVELRIVSSQVLGNKKH